MKTKDNGTPGHQDGQPLDFKDPKSLNDRALVRHLCSAIPGCMTCDIEQCAYGREFRRRIRTGEFGRKKKRHENG